MKKYMRFIMLFFCFLIISASFVSAKGKNIKGKTVIIDVGHGSKDPGTVYGNIYEKDINLEIGLALKKSLEDSGIKVLMTRDGDYDLAYPNATFRKKSDFDNRILMINNSKADLYISIHLNFLNDASYYGPQVFYDKDNKSLAEIIQKSLNKETNTGRKIKKIPSATYMYDKLIIPGVLIECGFLSNSNERSLLQSEKYQATIAKSITKGIINFFAK